MAGGVSKSRDYRFRAKLSKASQGELLDAFASKSARLPSSCEDRSIVSGDLVQSTLPPQSSKQQLDAVTAIGSKTARLTQIDVQTGSLRSSARVQARQQPGSCRDPTQPVPQAFPGKWQTEIGTGSALLPLNRARLTRKNLQRLQRITKSKSASGKRRSSVSSSTTNMTKKASKSTDNTLSTTSIGFEARTLENGILDRVDSKAPANLDDWRSRLQRDRESASPTESMFRDYVTGVSSAPNERTMFYETAKLLKDGNDRGYRKALNQPFTAFPKTVGFNNGLSNPQPDMVEGLQRRQFLPFPIGKLNGAALIKDDPYSISLPHLAGEWKGPGKDMNKARVQSAYDGAALVYGRNQALAFLGEPDPPDHAAVASFTTDGTNINFFSHHFAPSKEGHKTEYHQYPMTSTNLTNSFDGFKQGRKQLRNLQEVAREESYDLRDRLKGHWKTRQGEVASVLRGVTGELDSTPEESWTTPAQEYHSCPDDDKVHTQPLRSTKAARHKHTTRRVPPEAARSRDDESIYEKIDMPTYASKPPLSSNHGGGHPRVNQQLRQRSPSTHYSSAPCSFSTPSDNSASNSAKERQLCSYITPKTKRGQAHQNGGELDY